MTHMTTEAKQPRRRSSLSARGGAIRQAGDSAWAEELSRVLAASDTAETDDLTHGFHTYPARMHPRLARELIAGWAEPGAVVLDPFCGSGTVLVEALVAGCRPQGVDLNPLALRISEVHCALRSPASRQRFEQRVQTVAEDSFARVRSRARVQQLPDRAVQQHYQPHVLLELCGLLEAIEACDGQADRRALSVVFSALLVKFSRRRADTSDEEVDKRIRTGLVTVFCVRKASELVLRWEALYDAAPRDAFEVKLACGDARELPRLLGPRFAADLIVTSPPYGGTYDYLHQHALRAAWFGLDTRQFAQAEIGSRRALSGDPRAVTRWNRELLAVLRAQRALLRPDGRVVLWLGDAELGGARVEADRQVAKLAPEAGLRLVASAAQERPDVRGGAPRAEHLLLLVPELSV